MQKILGPVGIPLMGHLSNQLNPAKKVKQAPETKCSKDFQGDSFSVVETFIAFMEKAEPTSD